MDQLVDVSPVGWKRWNGSAWVETYGPEDVGGWLRSSADFRELQRGGGGTRESLEFFGPDGETDSPAESFGENGDHGRAFLVKWFDPNIGYFLKAGVFDKRIDPDIGQLRSDADRGVRRDSDHALAATNRKVEDSAPVRSSGNVDIVVRQDSHTESLSSEFGSSGVTERVSASEAGGQPGCGNPGGDL